MHSLMRTCTILLCTDSAEYLIAGKIRVVLPFALNEMSFPKLVRREKPWNKTTGIVLIGQSEKRISPIGISVILLYKIKYALLSAVRLASHLSFFRKKVNIHSYKVCICMLVMINLTRQAIRISLYHALLYLNLALLITKLCSSKAKAGFLQQETVHV